MRVAFFLIVLIVAPVLAVNPASPDRPRPDGPAAQHGVPVNGLRLEVTARFIPEEAGWGSPRIEETISFHNETDATICLDGYSTHFRLVLAHISPSNMVQEKSYRAPPFCGVPVDEKSVLRVPAKNKHQFKVEGWCSSFEIPYGRIVDGMVVDDNTYQIFELKRTGALTLAYMYRSDGPVGAALELQKFLAPGEKLWSGRVYSNPVTIHVAKLRLREEIKVR